MQLNTRPVAPLDLLISSEPLSLNAVTLGLHGPESGAVVLFLGTVRNSNEGRHVIRLAYEAYGPMALEQLARLRDALLKEFQLTAVRIHHRIGELQLGEIAMIAAVCAPHRKAALQAMDALIDQLKKDVPIWKREYFQGGDVWVGSQKG
jgi:molybdopterin synthase catalytic subunit